MNTGTIIASILNIVKKIFSRLAGVRKLPGFKRYMLLAVILTLVFTALMFPYEIIVMNQLKKLEGKNLRSISAGAMDINIIGESYIESADITFRNGDALAVNALTADISLLSLIRKKISGNIMAEKINFSSDKLKLDLSPNASLDFTLDESGTMPLDGKIKAIIDNVRIASDGELLGGFPLPPSIKISSINMESDIVKSALTNINITVSGQELRGKITGSIILMPIFGNSKLNLKISIDADSLLLAEFKPLLARFIDASGKITFPVSGTAARPKADFGTASGAKAESAIPPFGTNPEE
ncbi:MAG: hypothetical protein LBT84_01530 [Spirochaetia bacterium]|jgi:hypothetical protein|nr:hypothetical protein [Spirochaetia bacterium]